LLLIVLLLPVVSHAQITQRAWALQLIDSLGWSYGLPQKPTDEDYVRLLEGKRLYRIEAEDSFQRGDRVAVMSFSTFGEFSGSGWLNGTRDYTQVRLKFHLPHSGRYKLRARVRRPEHHLIFGTRDFRISGGEQFTTVDAGYVELQAGEQEALLRLRPNGSIDYFELEALPLGTIAPVGGWKFDKELTAEDAALTLIQALKLQHLLPPGKESLRLEAENLVAPAGTRFFSGNSKGVASQGRYLQVGPATVNLQVYLANHPGGAVDILVRAAGKGSLTAGITDKFAASRTLSPAFSDLRLGTVFLPAGEASIDLRLPAGAAFDWLELRSRKNTPVDHLALVGLSLQNPPSASDLNNLSALLYRLKTQP
jgi:hypothetical protein